jgi:formate dehydrogenase
MSKKITYSICGFCEAACGIKVTSEADQVLSIEPDRENPHNWKDFCIKGARADMMRSHPARIRQPMKRVGDSYVPVSYDIAIEEIAREISRIVDVHGPDAIGSYAGNPAGFNVSNSTFYGAFLAALGTRSHFMVGSVDQNSFHVVCDAMYGSAWFSMQTDPDYCDLLMLIGSNPAVSKMNWMGGSADGWRRALDKVRQGGELVIVDPRRTESAKAATQYIAAMPGQDWAFLLMMLKYIFAEGLEDAAVMPALNGGDALRALVAACDYDDLAARCEVGKDVACDLARRFATAGSAACISRSGPAQGRNGAIIEWLANCMNVVTGNLSKRGGRFYNNNIVDVAAFAKMMMPSTDRLSRVRGIRTVCGGMSLVELADEIETPGPGQVRGMFINSGNPVLSGPNGDRLDRALASLELLVSIDMFQRESHRHSHWLIPGAHYLERNELNILIASFRTENFIQAAKQSVPPPPGVIPEWQFFRDLARAMDLPIFPGMNDPTPEGVVGMVLSQIPGPFTLDEILSAEHGLMLRGEGRIPDMRDVVHTPDRKVHVAPEQFVDAVRARLAEPVESRANAEWPYQIISRRSLPMMNSFLADTVGADMRHKPAEMVEISRADAEHEGIGDGELVMVSSVSGTLTARALVTDDIRPGVLVMAHGWGGRLFDPAAGTVQDGDGVNRNRLVCDSEIDPLTGSAILSGMPVRVTRIAERMEAA